MAQITALAEGARITHNLGRVTVVLTCIRPGASYRAAVHHGPVAGTLGPEVPELSQSWPTEAEARTAARRSTIAFRNLPANLPFTVAVAQALDAIAAQLDDAIGQALGGGDGTGRAQAPLGRLTRAREALSTPAERIAEGDLIARLNADLDAYDTNARYAAGLEAAAREERTPEDPAERSFETWQRNAALMAADRQAAQSFRQIKARHAAAAARDRRYADVT